MKKNLALVALVVVMGINSLWATTVSQQFTLTIAPAPLVITTLSLPAGQVGVAYGPIAVQASGGVLPYTWSATGLPAGLSINSASGTISGTPTSICACSVTVTVTDANTSSISKTLSTAAPGR